MELVGPSIFDCLIVVLIFLHKSKKVLCTCFWASSEETMQKGLQTIQMLQYPVDSY